MPDRPEYGPAVATAPVEPAERVYLWIEYLTLFGLLPLLFCFRSVHVPLPLLLLSAAATCWWLLSRDRDFDPERLWNAPGFFRGLPAVLALWLVGVVVLAAGVKWLAPDQYLDFPRDRPGLWLAVMVLYPLVSVYPQNIVYRVFVFHRYSRLFESRESMIWASTLAFCCGHIIFLNATALCLTFLGGFIFARSYAKYRSALLVSFEHALYGCLVFTVGLGQSLYLEAVQAR
ncbi:MAG: CPBP family intramembrane metalloprotease [Planctomycetes bacterium]|nr:CPBP family intramembrane metalloprotease [Planctomycetota bacterium]